MSGRLNREFAIIINTIYMSKYILTKNQLQRILETGSNSAAMDLDIYVQPVYYDTSNGNENIKDSIDETIKKLKELKYSFDHGKKISHESKFEIFKVLDRIKLIYEKIKRNP